MTFEKKYEGRQEPGQTHRWVVSISGKGNGAYFNVLNIGSYSACAGIARRPSESRAKSQDMATKTS